MLAWMITAKESSTVASYRVAAVRSPVPIEVVSRTRSRRIRCPQPTPDLKGISHVQPGPHLDALRRGHRGIQHGPTRAASDTGTEPRRPRLRRRLGPAHTARAATGRASRCQNRPPGSHSDLKCRKWPPIWPFGSMSRPPLHQFAASANAASSGGTFPPPNPSPPVACDRFVPGTTDQLDRRAKAK